MRCRATYVIPGPKNRHKLPPGNPAGTAPQKPTNPKKYITFFCDESIFSKNDLMEKNDDFPRRPLFGNHVIPAHSEPCNSGFPVSVAFLVEINFKASETLPVTPGPKGTHGNTHGNAIWSPRGPKIAQNYPPGTPREQHPRSPRTRKMILLFL